jgi:hypothetical protein
LFLFIKYSNEDIKSNRNWANDEGISIKNPYADKLHKISKLKVLKNKKAILDNTTFKQYVSKPKKYVISSLFS